MDFAKARILCLGDVMLDQFAYGAAERISPEAPVPVLRLQETRAMLGGAGNVARNIAALGGQAVLLGLLGLDHAADDLRRLVRETAGIADATVVSASRPTIRKTRYMAGNQQLLRVDEEQAHALDGAETGAVIAALERLLPRVDAVVLSDYAKGVLTPAIVERAIAGARALGIPSFVDPKCDDFRRYRGAVCITPNQRELALAARMPVGADSEVIAAAHKVRHEADAGAILATRSEKGMILVEASGAVHIEPARAQEVYDVSGAGDTVIAVLALAVANGYPLPEAMRLANTAAGIVVRKLGTATVELDELMLELSYDVLGRDGRCGKYYTTGEAETLVRRWKSCGLRVGFTNGCFDILHAGHVSLLAAARAQCDRLLVALNTDESVRRLKGPQRPINPLADRTAVIAAVDAVDAVVSFAEETPLDLIRRFQPDLLVKGGDYTIDGVVGADLVQAAGGRVLLVDPIENRSTSRLIDTIRLSPPEKGAVLVDRARSSADEDHPARSLPIPSNS